MRCCVNQFWPNVTEIRYFADIIVLSVTYSGLQSYLEFGKISKIGAIMSLKAIQDHQCRYFIADYCLNFGHFAL